MSAGIFGLLSTGLKVFGIMRESDEQAQAAMYNAQIMQQRAHLAQQAGELEAKHLQKAKTSMEGKQRAGYARSGVSSLSGSPLAVIADTAAQYEIDIASTRYNAKVQSMQYMSQSRQDELMARNIRSAGKTKVFSTLLEKFAESASSSGGGLIGQRSI